MLGDGRFPLGASVSSAKSPADPGWRPTTKNSLNEEDFLLFIHRRRPIGERRSSLALRSGWQEVPPGFFLPPK
jgi:hypothetical protein